MTKTKQANREAWLQAAIEHLTKNVLTPAKYEAPKQVWVSVGFPKGARGKGAAIGQCWPGMRSADKNGHIFISPVLTEGPRILDVLLHELGHDIVGCDKGHKKPFADFCKAVGLVKPWTATTASPELKEKLDKIVAKLGPYPHAALSPGLGMTKQTTRMRKYECPECGQIIRAATDDLNAVCGNCECPFEKA